VGLDALNARAEAYFQSTDNWDQQTGKPFSSITDAPSMLISLGVLLHGARLVPGMSVLDFGGGTGWLSRALMQLGCDVTLCDVSATALKIAQEFVQRNPPIGDNAGKLNVALFDGHTIPVASEQFDRIICFDSFHHVPNVPNVLAEFVRVLRPGGVAAFSEPGPEHSRSPQSQYEMRMYGVLENDVDVHAIWTTANALGFDDIRLAPFDVAPAFIRLPQFDDFLAHGESLQTAARHLRDYAANVRTFVLKKAGVERVDSRTATGLRAEIRVTVESTPAANEPTRARATVKNTGTHIWLPSAQKRGGVSLAAHLYQDGAIVDFDFLWLSLSDSEIGPNEEVSVDAVLPALGAGHYVLEFDCVANGVTWFAQVGSRVATVELTVR
jgi:2-polyprenyl-3-methyl-5-hydroxy-6-metoxy-1,4-benzoquinol methylase